MNFRPNRLSFRARIAAIKTGPTHCETVQGYSDEMLSGAIRDLCATVTAGNAGSWERQRLGALRDEQNRRNAKRRGKESA